MTSSSAQRRSADGLLTSERLSEALRQVSLLRRDWDSVLAAQLSSRTKGWFPENGESDHDVAGLLLLVCAIDRRLGARDREERRLRYALTLMEGAQADPRRRLMALDRLVGLLDDAGRTVEADEIQARAVHEARLQESPDKRAQALTLSSAGLRAHTSGNVAEAEVLLQEALAATGVPKDTDDPAAWRFVAQTLATLSATHHMNGDWEAATEDAEAAVSLYERLGDRRATLIQKLSIADTRYRSGDRTGASEAREQVELALQRASIPGDLSAGAVAEIVGELATYWEGDEPDRPERLLRQALSHVEREDASALEVAARLRSLGKEQRRKGNFADAAASFDRAETIIRARTDPGEARDARALLSKLWLEQALLARILGQPQLALRLARDAVDVGYGVDLTTTSGWDRTRTPHYPASAIREYALASAAAGRPTEALRWLKDVANREADLAGQVFCQVGEAGQLNYMGYLRATTAAALSVALDFPSVAAFAYGLVLRRKGLVGDVAARRRAWLVGERHPELSTTFARWRAGRVRLAGLVLSGPDDTSPPGDFARELRDVKRSIGALESQLIRAAPDLAWLADAPLGHEDVGRAIGDDTAVIEYVRFGRQTLRGSTRGGPQAEYAAFVVLPGDPPDLRLVPLGPAEAIETALASARPGAANATRDLESEQPPPKSDGGSREARSLLFDPVEAHLQGRHRVFMAPDGELATLSFAALPKRQSGYLVDDYLFSYAICGRDVLRETIRQPVATPAVFADPDFDLARSEPPPAPTQESKLHTRRFRSFGSFGRLKGAREEGLAVGRILGVDPRLGALAGKSDVQRLASPGILHLATHGFFLPFQQALSGDEDEEAAGFLANRRAAVEPMLRCGLAFAGANTALAALAPSGNDGILNGEEMAALDLRETSLVTMSACQSGLGDVRVGEGVLGLGRAALIAGAQTVVMSLWRVPDDATARLMQSFYRHLVTGMPRGEALRTAQLELRAEAAHPHSWGAFICLGQSGPMAFD